MTVKRVWSNLYRDASSGMPVVVNQVLLFSRLEVGSQISQPTHSLNPIFQRRPIHRKRAIQTRVTDNGNFRPRIF